VLDGIYVQFQLKKIGHFRAFVSVFLRAIKLDILMIWFGSSDKSNRFRADIKGGESQPAGIAHGISSGQWERQVKLSGPEKTNEEDENQTASPSAEDEDKRQKREFVHVGGRSSMGMDPVPAIIVHCSHDDSLFRFRPRLQLRDLDDCMLMPVLNQQLAEKLHSIQVFANGYKLADIGPDDFMIDRSPYKGTVPDAFTPGELADSWVRLRPSSLSSTFHLRFTSTTPRRMYGYEEPRDTPPKTI
jgi:hypothetical protein